MRKKIIAFILLVIIAVLCFEKIVVRAEDNVDEPLPGMIKTEDTKSLGVKINLIDYEADDTSTNTPQSPSDAGINQYTDLKFFGQGGTPSEVGDENTYTGDSIVRQGTMKGVAGSDGYPVSVKGNSLSAVFNEQEIDGVKKVYSDLNHFFTKKDGYYTYNSNKNYAYYDESQGSGGKFKIYNDTYDVFEIGGMGVHNTSGNRYRVGFFPLDAYNPSKVDVGPSDDLENMGIEGYNHHYGLTIESDFYYTSDKKIDGRDMIFEFSGDDDVSVFLDDVLVLDLGGIHNEVSGKIDFTTGEVTINNPISPVEGISDTIGQNATIDGIFSRVDKVYDSSVNSKHTMKFYYVERGGCYSNVSVLTNIFAISNHGTKNIPVEKKWADSDEVDHSNDQIEVELYADDVLVEGANLILNNDNNWKGEFKDLPRFIIDEQGNAREIKYTIKEVDIDDYVPHYSQGTMKDVVTRTYWIKTRNFEDGGEYVISSYNWQDGGYTGIANSNQNGELYAAGRDIKIERTTEYDTQGNGIYEIDPLSSQIWIAHQNGNDHQWQFENDGKFLALSGTPDNNEANYGIELTNQDMVKDENTGRFYNTTFWFDYDSTKLMGTVYFDQGESSLYFLYLGSGINLGASTRYEWSANFDIYKKIDEKDVVHEKNYENIENVKEDSGNLTIEKRVINSKDAADKSYKFRLSLDNQNVSGRYGDLLFSNGVAEFELRNGDNKIASKLPVGASYEIVEIDENSNEIITKTRDSGIIEANKTIASVFKQVGKIDISVTIKWDDANNAYKQRPSTVDVQLYEDGKPYDDPVTIGNNGKWEYTWNNLDGEKKWTVDEVKAPTNYSKTVESSGNVFVITNKNTYVEKAVSGAASGTVTVTSTGGTATLLKTPNTGDTNYRRNLIVTIVCSVMMLYVVRIKRGKRLVVKNKKKKHGVRSKTVLDIVVENVEKNQNNKKKHGKRYANTVKNKR